MAFQGLLFSEPSIAETGVWCTLSDGIDPAQWAMVCRHIGSLSPKAFEQVKGKILQKPDFTKRNFSYCNETFVDIPIISIGPSGVGGQYQQEI
jgi:hypothetical protein